MRNHQVSVATIFFVGIFLLNRKPFGCLVNRGHTETFSLTVERLISSSHAEKTRNNHYLLHQKIM